MAKEKTRRLDLKMGFSCNNNCLSCPQAQNRHLGDLSTEQVKRNLETGFSHGANEAVLTGGEPTMRDDLCDIIRHARDIGYEHVQIQTNGRRLCYKPFVRSLIVAGVTEFAPAIHGHTPEIHDYITRSPGAFNQAVRGIRNIKELGQHVVMNSVITKLSFRHLPEIAQLFTGLRIDQFQFAFIHPIGNAWKNFDLLVPRKSDAMKYVHDAIDIAVSNETPVMIEAYPFCFMGGYERHCSELYMPPSEIIDAKGITRNFDQLRKAHGKAKFEQCSRCRFDMVCEGPWKEYAERYGPSEFVPVMGKGIKDSKQIIEHE